MVEGEVARRRLSHSHSDMGLRHEQKTATSEPRPYSQIFDLDISGTRTIQGVFFVNSRVGDAVQFGRDPDLVNWYLFQIPRPKFDKRRKELTFMYIF